MLATALRSTELPTTISDNFQRPDGSLGVTPVGFLPWIPLTGAWTITSNKAHTTAAASTNPLIVVETGTADVDASATVSASGGDCLYARVTDANNWIRLRVREYTTSSSYYAGDGWQPAYTQTCEAQTSVSPGQSYYYDYQNGVPTTLKAITSTSCTGAIGTGGAGWTANWHHQTVSLYYNYYSNYQVLLEKNVAGTVTALNTTNMSGVTTLRIVAQGSTVTAYANGTQIWTGTITDGATATEHGVGLGGPTDTTSSAISAFSVQLAP